MKDFDEILTQLKSDITGNIPALLSAESLSDFDEYDYGPGRDADKVGLYLYPDNGDFDDDQNNFSVIFQAQLTEIDTLTATKYANVLYKYLKTYNPKGIGMVALDSISYENWPIEHTQGSIIFLVCTWKEELDSCDFES